PRPESAGGFLAAILANTGRIAFDVAGIERRMVEGRGEKHHQSRVPPDQMLLHRRHGSRGGGGRRRAPARGITRSPPPAGARAGRDGAAAPEITPQDCAIESIRHSSPAEEPRG